MHALFLIPELVDYLLSFLSTDPRSLRRLALTCRLLWPPCTLLLYADQSLARQRESFRRLGALYLDYWEEAALHPEKERRYWQRLRVYAGFVRRVVGTIPPRTEKERGALPWPAYKGLENLLVQWPSDPLPLSGAGVGGYSWGIFELNGTDRPNLLSNADDVQEPLRPPLFCNLRYLKVGLESPRSLTRLSPYLAPTLTSLELVLGEEIPLPLLASTFSTLPLHCPGVEDFALETLVASHRGIQSLLAKLLPRWEHLRSLRLRVAIGTDLLYALEKVPLRALTLYLFDTNYAIPLQIFASPPSGPDGLDLSSPFPQSLSLPGLTTLNLFGEPHTTALFLLSAISPPSSAQLHTLTLRLNGFSTPPTLTRLCSAIALASPTLQTLELRSLAARTQGGPARTLSPQLFAPLYACSQLQSATFVGGWQGRDRLLWTAHDLEDIARHWPRLRKLELVSQLWHGHRFDPLATLPDLLPLAEHCTELKSLSIALDLRDPPPSLPPNFTPGTELETLYLSAYSLPPKDEEAELAASRWVRRVWPRARVVVDPDSTNSPGELERWVDGVAGGWRGEEEREGDAGDAGL